MEFLLIAMFLTLFLPLGVALFFVFATARRSRWGINFDAASAKCPNCGSAPPMLRKPASVRRMMWGGWTCEHCGAEIDKWGRAVERIAK